MRAPIVLVKDPQGNQVYFPPHLCMEGESIELYEIYDDIKTVIEAPACIIEIDGERKFYFRALGWNLNVLIEVVHRFDIWLAVNCMKNPDTEYISGLLKRGKFIPGSSID